MKGPDGAPYFFTRRPFSCQSRLSCPFSAPQTCCLPRLPMMYYASKPIPLDHANIRHPARGCLCVGLSRHGDHCLGTSRGTRPQNRRRNSATDRSNLQFGTARRPTRAIASCRNRSQRIRASAASLYRGSRSCRASGRTRRCAHHRENLPARFHPTASPTRCLRSTTGSGRAQAELASAHIFAAALDFHARRSRR